MELAVFAKDGIEFQNLLREKPEVTSFTEPILELEIQGEIEAQRKNREVRNQEKNVAWEHRCQKIRGKGVMCNSVVWDETDARLRSYLFLCFRHGRSKTSPTKMTWVKHPSKQQKS